VAKRNDTRDKLPGWFFRLVDALRREGMYALWDGGKVLIYDARNSGECVGTYLSADRVLLRAGRRFEARDWYEAAELMRTELAGE
jgi:hypothetical protein